MAHSDPGEGRTNEPHTLSAEQIIGMLREAEVGLAQGEKVGAICHRLGVSKKRYCRWHREYGGMQVNRAPGLKDLEW